MKLLVDGTKIVGTASDNYRGKKTAVDVPEGFDFDHLEWYQYVNGIVSPAVPAQVTRRQARQALYLAGLLSSVQPAIDAISDATQRNLIQIEWEDSLTFERTRPSLIALATALGLNSSELDSLFITARAIE